MSPDTLNFANTYDVIGRGCALLYIMGVLWGMVFLCIKQGIFPWRRHWRKLLFWHCVVMLAVAAILYHGGIGGGPVTPAWELTD